MKRLGVIVNPVAGMGGSVGLKGTDGGLYEKALELGAEPVTPDRASAFLAHIGLKDRIQVLAAPGEMGARHVQGTDLTYTVVGDIGDETSAEDTERLAGLMVQQGADLLAFVGGDGTARDIHDAIGCQIPVVAVPAGVKVYSAVFAINPRAAAELVDAFLEDGGVTEQEVLDIDEQAFREDRLASEHYGYLLVPQVGPLLQEGKVASSRSASVREAKKDIAASVVDGMDRQVLYLLGPGTTVRAVSEAMGLPKTLLGIDAVHDGRAVGEDLNEQAILDLFDQFEKRVIIVTPLGGNGFIFGRGNKPFTPEVIRRTGPRHIRIIATRQKLRSLDSLRVDTGNVEVDEMLSGWKTVTVGYHENRMIKVSM